jgi:predicted kinase
MKLILINGSTGVGKSTVAQKVHQMYPLSFLLEMDDQRRYINGYREFSSESKRLSLMVSEAIADTYLSAGHNVIIDKFLTDVDVVEKFFAIGKKHNADVYEFILNAPKEVVVKRAEERGYKKGGLLTPEKVVLFWEEIQEHIKKRPQAVVIDTETLSQEEVYKYITDNL